MGCLCFAEKKELWLLRSRQLNSGEGSLPPRTFKPELSCVKGFKMSNTKEMFANPAFAAVEPNEQTGRGSAIGALFSVQTLKQAALKIADARRGTGFHTRDLVGLLACHAARNKRLSQPNARMRMVLPVSFNTVAVRITIDS